MSKVTKGLWRFLFMFVELKNLPWVNYQVYLSVSFKSVL